MQYLNLLLCPLYILLNGVTVLTAESTTKPSTEFTTLPLISPARKHSAPPTYTSSTSSVKDHVTPSATQRADKLGTSSTNQSSQFGVTVLTAETTTKPSTEFTTPPLISSSRKHSAPPAYTSSTSSVKDYVAPNATQSADRSTNQSPQFGNASSSFPHFNSSFVGASSTSFANTLQYNVTSRQSNTVFSTSQPSSSLATQFMQSASVDKSRLSFSHYINSSTNVQIQPTVLPSPSSTYLVTSSVTSSVIHKPITSVITSSSFGSIRESIILSTSQSSAFSTTQAIRSSVRKSGSSSSHYISPSTKPFGPSLTASYTNKLMTSFSIHQSTSSSTASTTRSTPMSTLQLTNPPTTLAQSKLSATSGLKTTMTLPSMNSSIYAVKSRPSVTFSVHTSPTKDVSGSGKKSKNRTSLIVGVTVGITVALVLCITIVICYRRKRASHQYNVFYDEQNIVMNPFDGPR